MDERERKSQDDFSYMVAQMAEPWTHIEPYHRWREGLKKITRFELVPEMIHRGTVLEHTSRMNNLVDPLGDFVAAFGTPVDPLRTSHLVDHHDDAEIITTDIPSDIKMRMSTQEKGLLIAEEQAAIKQLSTSNTTPAFVDLYQEYFAEAAAKATPEAQVTAIADKWDGISEVLTNIRSGVRTEKMFTILQNYHRLFAQLEEYPIWNSFKEDDYFGFMNLPNREEAEQMSLVDIDLYKKDPQVFWSQVLDPSLPKVYKRWLGWTSRGYRRAFNPSQIFPGWKDTLIKETPGRKVWGITQTHYEHEGPNEEKVQAMIDETDIPWEIPRPRTKLDSPTPGRGY